MRKVLYEPSQFKLIHTWKIILVTMFQLFKSLKNTPRGFFQSTPLLATCLKLNPLHPFLRKLTFEILSQTCCFGYESVKPFLVRS